MKTKITPQTFRKKMIAYVPLLIALGVVSAWLFFVRYNISFLRDPLFFILPIQLDAGWLFIFILSALCILCLYALYLGARPVLAVLSGLSMVGISCLLALGLWLFRPKAIEVDTLVSDRSAYHLFYVSNDFQWDNPADAYYIVECWTSGLWCHVYSRPYFQDRPGPYSQNRHCDEFSLEAHLAKDPKTQQIGVLMKGHFYADPKSKHLAGCSEEEES